MAPVASAVEDGKTASHDYTSSLAFSVPEMYRRTLAAMMEGQKVSPLIPVPHIPCCSQPAVELEGIPCCSRPAVTLDELQGTSDEELLQKADVQAEKMDEEIADKGVSTTPSDASPWIFKPSVATWLMPLHSNEDGCKEGTALKASESSEAAAVQETPAATVAKVQRKGLGARIKAFFGCAQASAAEPKSMKTPKAQKTSKARKAPKTAKSKP
jgi:hypothetical protein